MTLLTPLKDVLHVIASALLIPTIVILLLLLAAAAVELGGLLVEILMERRRVRVDVAGLLAAFQGQGTGTIREEIGRSLLPRRQKKALAELVDNSHLPAPSLRALARRLLDREERHYARITDRTDLVARLAPMFGLMGTLIPLGPGLIGLGQGNTKALADSLLIAFDTTVAGLAAAGVAYAISRLRKRWYEDYLSALEAMLVGLLEVFARGRGIEEEEKQPLQIGR
ncbi:MAG: MotA/TolQ/ExbB proton channel family protein [bacterium]|jgi:biopolymer transport protein ExbB/TolQ